MGKTFRHKKGDDDYNDVSYRRQKFSDRRKKKVESFNQKFKVSENDDDENKEKIK